MCVCFVSRPMKFVTFLRKKGETPKRVVDFPRERDTFRNKIIEIVKDFDEKSYKNNGKPWKSSRILCANPNFFIFFIFSFFFIFCILFHFSLTFCPVLSFFLFFSFVLFLFLFLFVGGSKSDFFGPQFRYTPLRPIFLFFPPFF